MKSNQAVPLPTDNWLRDDLGLPPLTAPRPLLELTPRTSGYFPTDDWLRDDIGLPPLREEFHAEGARSSTGSITQRIASSCAIPLGVIGASLEGYVTAVAAVLRSRRHTRILRESTLRRL
jgi:hypothetical protein